MGRRMAARSGAGRTVAVIGGGFSGTICAIHLLQHLRGDDRVVLIERERQLGRGVAFATAEPSHLLNVRAENMSAFPDEPLHLLRWLDRLPADERRQGAKAGAAGTFVQRGLYGRYVRDQLAAVLRAGRHADRLTILNDQATRLVRHGSRWHLATRNGRSLETDIAVLATGNFPPAPLPYAGCVDNPWQPEAVEEIDRDHPVLLLGSGLTMIDVVLRLVDRGFRSTVHVLSRRGLLPRTHAPAPVYADLLLDAEDRRSLVSLTRAVRREITRAEIAGFGWRSVIDALRPHSQLLWQELSPADRRRFVRHLRPWWDVHRHRAAPDVAERIHRLQAEGRLVLHAGRLEALEPSGPWSCGALATYRPRGASASLALEVQRVINCTGTAVDLAAVDDPLIRQLLASGTVRADSARLGLDCTTSSMMIDAAGQVVPGLFGVGPVVRGAFWEITSVPDIRSQAVEVAKQIGRSLAGTVPAAA